jgi:polar amino acid transport system substrate-binding protein
MRSPAWGRPLAALVALATIVAACGGEASDTETTLAEAGADTTEAPPVETTGVETTVAAETTLPADECAVENLSLVAPGTLTVATGEPAFPPWVGTTDGEGFDDPTSKLGFEAALVYAVAAELGFSDDQVTWVRTEFTEAIAPGPKDWDFNVQQYSITEDREEVVDFSAPYYTTRQALVVYADSPYASVASLADLKDAVLGAAIGTTSLDFVENVIQPNTQPNVYDENVDLKSAMDAGQIEGLVLDLPTAYFVTAVELEGAVIAGQFEAEAADADEFGLLFAQDNPLVGCVDQALETLRSGGTLQDLEDTFLTLDGGIPIISG